jgi:hypothetical protein
MTPEPSGGAVAARGADEVAHVYALAEHVELSRSGWWRTAIDRAILHTLYGSPAGAETSVIVSAVTRLLDCPDDRHMVTPRLQALVDQGDLLVHRGAYVLSESRRVEIADERQRGEQLDLAVREHFARVCRELGESVTSWDEFNVKVVGQIVTELGARTVDLISGRVEVSKSRAYLEFVHSHPDRELAEKVCLGFLDPSNDSVRSYMMARLNHYFLVASKGVNRSVLRSLADSYNGRPKFNLVLDTNTIFSILGLHRNPANEATEALVGLRQRTSEYIDVRMFVLPTSLEEARAALEGALAHAPTHAVSSAMIDAAEELRELSGLVGRYLEKSRERPQTSSSYFRYYIDHLEALLEAKGVKVVGDADVTGIAERASVRRAVSDQLTFEEVATRPRSRRAIEHDVVAMEFVRDRRPPAASTVAEVGWWFLTVDIGLQKREMDSLRGRRGIPRSVMPDELSQILRFWVPRSERLERALMGGIRLPFSFFSYDNRSQEVSIAILDALAAYERSDELPIATIRSVLADKTVRQSFEDEQAQGARLERIESALAANVNARDQEIQEQRRHIRELQASLAAAQRRQGERAAIVGGKEESKQALLRRLERLERDLGKERSAREASKRELDELHGQLQAMGELERQARSRVPLAKVVSVIAGLLAGAVTWTILAVLVQPIWWRPWGLLEWASAALLAALAAAGAVVLTASRLDVGEWRLVRFLRKHARLLWIFVVLPVASNLLAALFLPAGG